MKVIWAEGVGNDWAEMRDELERIFRLSRETAQAEASFVYVVRTEHLLGKGGIGNAMVATGLLSAARTAALEGSRKGWTVNVIGVDDDTEPAQVDQLAETVAATGGVTGELIRFGPGHLGKALP
jgi:hypothetical protein